MHAAFMHAVRRPYDPIYSVFNSAWLHTELLYYTPLAGPTGSVCDEPAADVHA